MFLMDILSMVVSCHLAVSVVAGLDLVDLFYGQIVLYTQKAREMDG